METKEYILNYEKYHLNNNSYIITEQVPGPKAKALLIKQQKLESNNCYYPKILPLAINRAKGSIVEDVDGNVYIDFLAGSGVLNLGHNNREILSDMREQEEKFIHGLDFPTEIKIKLMEELNSQLPKGLKDKVKFNFCAPTGADAIEAAIKLARINTGRHSLISFTGAYHGMTGNALGVTGHLYHKPIISATSGIQFMPYSYCYRCHFEKSPEDCNLLCARALRSSLNNPSCGIEKPAAIILESIQGEGGTIVPAEGFLDEIIQIGNDFNIPVIFDEIQAGFYRTGKLFSFQNFCKKTPDLITVSKGFGGIGMPISILIIKEQYDIWQEGTHLGTFRGNQLSFAASYSALKFVKENNIENHVSMMSKEIISILNALKDHSHFIGDVRGKGFMIGIEYVKDKTTKLPFPEIVEKLVLECFKNGLIITSGGNYSNVIRFLPPLISTKEIILNGLKIFIKVHEELEREYFSKNN